MNIETIKRVIADQHEEISFRQNTKLVQRELLGTALSFLHEPVVKVITGVRRCGKSTFCHQLLAGRKYAYLNFDDERLFGINAEYLDKVLENLLMEVPNPEFIFLDEIQNITGWELFVNRLLRQGYNVVITGSNSKMLSRELATHLTGRHIQIELYPFSFKEYLDYHGFNSEVERIKSTKQIAEIQTHFNSYLLSGGFPEINNIENKKRYLRELFDSIILRDIVERFKIREISALKELSIVIVSYFSSLITFTKLKNSLNFKSVNTVREYLSYLEETYLISFVNRHSFKLKEEFRNPRKVYCVDTGMLNALQTTMTQNSGRLLENLVCITEKRKGSELSYFSDGTCEVDFVIRNNKNEMQLIQVAKDISNHETYKREVNALIKASDMLKCKEIYIITEQLEDKITISDRIIKVLPIWKYLLEV